MIQWTMTREQALKLLLPDGVIMEATVPPPAHFPSGYQSASVGLSQESAFALQLVEALVKLGLLV